MKSAQIRFLACTLALLTASAAHSQDNVLKDPRTALGGLRVTFDKGKPASSKNDTVLARTLLVINWNPPPDRNNPQLSESRLKDEQQTRGNGVWQISGLQGYFTQAEVEAILQQAYLLYSRDKEAVIPNLIVAGNNWASGKQIEPLVKTLSEKYQFQAYHLAGSFTEANLGKEPEHRIKLLKEAQAQAQKAADK